MGRGTIIHSETNHIVILPYSHSSSSSSHPPVPQPSIVLPRNTVTAGDIPRLVVTRNKPPSIPAAPSTSLPSLHDSSSTSTCPGYAYCCCSCYPRPVRHHPYATTFLFFLFLTSLAASLYLLFPRTDIKFRITDEDYLIRQLITPTSLLPFFEIQLLNRITITNPNYVSFQLQDFIFTVNDENSDIVLVNGAGSTDDSLTPGRIPFLTLTTSCTLNVPAGSPQSPKESKYIVSVVISTNNTPRGTDHQNQINLASALNCARAMYGSGPKTCDLLVQVSAQPVYLGLGKGIIPRQKFTFPLQIRGNT